MTPERAKQLIVNCNFKNSNMRKDAKLPFPAETHEEAKEVVKVWNRMDGSTCYYDALCRIARGEGHET